MAKIRLPYNFEPRDYQLPLFRAMDSGKKRAIAVWHRRAGKDLACLNLMIKKAFERVGSYYYYFPTGEWARKALWNGINKDGFPFMGYFPNELVVRSDNQTMSKTLKNGSIFQVVGTDRSEVVGPNPVGCVFSEFSLQNPKAWDFVRPILAENSGWALFNGTPRGMNHMYRLFQMAEGNDSWFSQVLTVNDTGAISKEAIEEERAAGMSDDLIEQEFYCFPAGTLIWTDSGQRPIEKIVEGEVVLTHAGRWRKVTNTMSRPYDGEVIEITSAGSAKGLQCTPEHPVRVCDPWKQTYKWVAAKDLTEDDYVVLPRTKPPKFRVISDELAELVAWYIAEGSTSKNHVQFSLNHSEVEFADRILAAGRRYGKAWSFEAETSLVVGINSCSLADFLVRHCGSGAINKRIPWGLISGHEALVYETLLDGDGCRGDYHGATEVYSTISYDLALDMQMLAHILGKAALVSMSRRTSCFIEGRECQCNTAYSVHMKVPEKCKRGRLVRPQKHGVATKIRKIKTKRFSGTVYNLSVKYDQSYVANGRVVHNCSWTYGLEGAYYLKHLSSAREQGRIGIFPYLPELPVNTAWDLGIGDSTAIWFWQNQGLNHRVIDYYEASGEGLAHYAKVLQDKGYIYGDHFAPHDIEVRELGSGKSRLEAANELGVVFNVLPKMSIEDGIEASRNLISKCYFNVIAGNKREGCEAGLDCLQNYQKQYDDKYEVFKDRPLHNWASHGADAFRYFALASDKGGKINIGAYRPPRRSVPRNVIGAVL